MAKALDGVGGCCRNQEGDGAIQRQNNRAMGHASQFIHSSRDISDLCHLLDHHVHPQARLQTHMSTHLEPRPSL